MSTPSTHNPANPLIIQGDRTLLLEVQNPHFTAARAAIAPFAELEKSPEYIHTYRITPLSLWNAAAAGLPAEAMIERLHAFAKYPLPQNVAAGNRELLKQALIAAGWPAEDLAGYVDGEAFPISLRNGAFQVRDYQRDAADSFYAGGDPSGGSGVVVLPPGAGKTMVGLAAMALVGQSTLILTTNRTSVNQWRREIVSKTDVRAEQIAEYTGERKGIAPITLSTYQMLTYRPEKNGDLPHLRLFTERAWGLIIYDEVHTLPAPVFRATAAIQARRRLGLTATLVREDGREADVFSLIGPKKYDTPWR